MYLWVCSEVKESLTARFAHQHEAVLPGAAAAAFQAKRGKKKIDVYTAEQQRTKATVQVSTALLCMLCIGLQGTVKIFDIQRKTNHLGCERQKCLL